MRQIEKNYYLNLVKEDLKQDMKKYLIIGGIILLVILTVIFWPKQKTKIYYVGGAETTLIGGIDDDIAKLEAQRTKTQADYDLILQKATSTIASADTVTVLKYQAQIKQIDLALAPLYAQRDADQQAAQKAAMIVEIKKNGYAGDGSLKDFQNLIKKRPDVWGEYSDKKAAGYYGGTTNIDGFIQLYNNAH